MRDPAVGSCLTCATWPAVPPGRPTKGLRLHRGAKEGEPGISGLAGATQTAPENCIQRCMTTIAGGANLRVHRASELSRKVVNPVPFFAAWRRLRSASDDYPRPGFYGAPVLLLAPTVRSVRTSAPHGGEA